MPVAFVKSSISGARMLGTSDPSKLTTFSLLAVGPRPHEPSRPLARAAPLAVPTARRKVRRLRGSIVGLPSLSDHYRASKGAFILNAFPGGSPHVAARMYHIPLDLIADIPF